MDRLSELAERCEKATGPEREMDCRIRCVVENMSFDQCLALVPNLSDWIALPYTASLDAAMTLVPEWWVYSGHELLSGVHTWDLNDRNSARVEVAEAATPALALCAAALRARSTNSHQG